MNKLDVYKNVDTMSEATLTKELDYKHKILKERINLYL